MKTMNIIANYRIVELVYLTVDLKVKKELLPSNSVGLNTMTETVVGLAEFQRIIKVQAK